MRRPTNKRANKTDAGNGSKAICRVSNILPSPSPDPLRSPEELDRSQKYINHHWSTIPTMFDLILRNRALIVALAVTNTLTALYFGRHRSSHSDALYTELALNCLADRSQRPELRQWALTYFQQTSPLPLSSEVASELIKDGRTLKLPMVSGNSLP